MRREGGKRCPVGDIGPELCMVEGLDAVVSKQVRVGGYDDAAVTRGRDREQRGRRGCGRGAESLPGRWLAVR